MPSHEPLLCWAKHPALNGTIGPAERLRSTTLYFVTNITSSATGAADNTILPNVVWSLAKAILFDHGQISLVIATAVNRWAEELGQAMQCASSCKSMEYVSDRLDINAQNTGQMGVTQYNWPHYIFA